MKTYALITFGKNCFFLVGFCMPALLNAQQAIGLHVNYGTSNVEVTGPGIPDFINDATTPLPQYEAGLTYEKSFSPSWSLETGANLSSRGFRLHESTDINLFGQDLPVGVRLDTRYLYVQAPVAIKYTLPAGKIKPYVKAGLTAGYALEAMIHPRAEAIFSWKLPVIPIDLQDKLFNRFDLSAIAGAGVKMPTNEFGSIQFELGYRQSLNDMLNVPLVELKAKSRGWSVGVGYTIRF